MTSEIIDWDEDLPPATPEEEYESLVRTLRRTNGFRLLFVECVPAEGERLIAKVQADFPQKEIEVLGLDKSVYNFYQIIEDLPKRDEINILFVTGLEYSLYEYEQEKRELGWNSEEIYSYSWRGVPPVLINLNQQRERFRDNFNICFVFVLPRFAVNYLIERAPDFFDWRSSLFKLSMDRELLQAESIKACLERGKPEDYLALSPPQLKRELIRIEALIDEDGQTPEQKVELFSEQALLYLSADQYAKAISFFEKALGIETEKHEAWNYMGNALLDLGMIEGAIVFYDKALELKPDDHEYWYNRGIALRKLGRLEAAIASFDKALEIQPDYHEAWNNRGYVMYNLGRFEVAIDSYDKALELKPDDHKVWYNRGMALGNLGRLETAIASYDKALELKPDDHKAWYNRGNALVDLGKLEEAIASYDKALELKPDDAQVWNNRGNVLGKLGRLEEAIASYDKALEFKPDYHEAFYNKAVCYALQIQIDQTIQNLQQAISLNSEEYREMAKTDSVFESMRSHPKFQALIQG